jgi:hypothetical protein
LVAFLGGPSSASVSDGEDPPDLYLHVGGSRTGESSEQVASLVQKLNSLKMPHRIDQANVCVDEPNGRTFFDVVSKLFDDPRTGPLIPQLMQSSQPGSRIFHRRSGRTLDVPVRTGDAA